MSKTKIYFSLILGLAVLFAQVGVANAAPALQEEIPITGTIQSIVVDTDTSTVVVTLLVEGVSQTLRISVETAISLGLIDEEWVVDESLFGTDVDIYPSTIIPDETPVVEKQHPVGAKIAEFFAGFFDVDYEMIMSSHSDGLGFGVITQALWITQKLGGDDTVFQTILDAKKTGDYSLIVLPDGTVPQNWGQLKKTVLKGDDNNSLGDVMSDKTKPENPGNGKPETPPGQDQDKQNNGNGKPENPPGQTKDKQNNGNGKK